MGHTHLHTHLHHTTLDPNPTTPSLPDLPPLPPLDPHLTSPHPTTPGPKLLHPLHNPTTPETPPSSRRCPLDQPPQQPPRLPTPPFPSPPLVPPGTVLCIVLVTIPWAGPPSHIDFHSMDNNMKGK